VAVSDLKEMGFDASEFLSGSLRAVAQPMADGAIGVFVDLASARLDIRDLGITKASGTPGALTALLRFGEDAIQVNDVDLAFGTVKLGGDINLDAAGTLVGARFDTFALSSGDSASVALAPIEGGGFNVGITGRQLD